MGTIRKKFFAYAFCMVMLVGCKGENPTNTEGLLLDLWGLMSNTQNGDTIVLCDIKFDGRQMSYAIRYDPPASSVVLSGSLPNATLKGHHTLKITITEQIGPANTYRVEGLNISVYRMMLTDHPPKIDYLYFPERTELMHTGDAMVYTIDR